MKRRDASVILVAILFMSVFCLAVITVPDNVRANTLFVGGSGPSNYTVIQDAMNASKPGDIIFIYSGAYSEELNITKPLTLIGEDRTTTSIHGSRDEGTVRIMSDWVNISELTIVGFGMDFKTGLVLSNADDCTVKDSAIRGEDGMGLIDSSNNRFINNSFYGYYSAIMIGGSHDNFFLNNTIYGMKVWGILMGDSNNTLILNNNITDSSHGISIWGSKNNKIIRNTFWKNPGGGLGIYYSSHMTVSGNEMVENGIYIEGDELEHWNTHVIESSNLINGKPAIFWKNATGGTISTDSGEVILANCTGVTVRDQITRDTDVGVMLGFSDANIISKNNLSVILGHWPYDSRGIFLDHSDDNLITNNLASGHLFGVHLLESANNTIMNNNASESLYGIYFENSENNSLISNIIYDNYDGMRMSSSSNNSVFHNNFIDNTNQAMESGGLNSWDDGYPSGGNYWSDYSGNDIKSGPNQDLPGRDGIGDKPYVINANSMDRYPLMNPQNITVLRPPTNPQAILSGPNLEHVTLTWTLSVDDNAGMGSTIGYSILRSTTYDPNGIGYGQVAFLANGTSAFVDSYRGEGDPNNCFYLVCAVDSTNSTSCARNQVAKFTRPLSKGPNLVSIPLIQSDETMQTVLQTLSYDNAWSYDPINQEWKSFSNSKPYGQSLEYLNHTMGIWVNVTQDSNLTVAGVVPTSTTIDLQAGWNLVGFPSFDDNYTVADLKAVVVVERIEGYDVLAPPYFLRAMADGDFLRAGFGYWIKVESPAIWTVENV